MYVYILLTTGVEAGDVIILIPICILGGWDWPGGSALAFTYTYFVDSCIGRRLGYMCRVAGCPSNRRVMSDFSKKSRKLF